jgi:hypothetical protein
MIRGLSIFAVRTDNGHEFHAKFHCRLQTRALSHEVQAGHPIFILGWKTRRQRWQSFMPTMRRLIHQRLRRLLQVDGYVGYNHILDLRDNTPTQPAYSWAQARRKLYERTLNNLAPLPKEWLKQIGTFWNGHILYLENGRIETNSTAIERITRPIALQRKNALFASYDAGAQNWAKRAADRDLQAERRQTTSSVDVQGLRLRLR